MQEIITQTKICGKCGIDKHIDQFYFRKDIGSYRKECKECHNNKNKENAKNNKEYIAEYNRIYQQKNNKYILEYKRLYREKNKESIKEYNIEYINNNKEYIAKYKKEYQQINKDKLSNKNKIYRQTERGKNNIQEQMKKYSRTPKGKAVKKNDSHKRRALKNKGDVTSNQIMELQQSTKLCYWCHEPLKNLKPHIDHYVALSKGGEHTLSNLVVSCSKCNLQKSSKDPITFANSIGRLL